MVSEEYQKRLFEQHRYSACVLQVLTLYARRKVVPDHGRK
jgi:hypothetical protein